jgi:protein TonB
MSEQLVTSGMGGENRQITTALIVSLLLHIAVVWFGQDLSVTGSEKGVAPVYHTIEVALEPARPLQERAVVQRQPRPLEAARTPHRQAPEAAMTQLRNEQAASVPEAGAATDSQRDEGTAEAIEPVAHSGGALDVGIRERYLAAVLAHIESHKFYPLPARRRGLQGQVDVRFILDARGTISDLDVTGSNSLFVEAARTAVRSAIPLPAAPSMDGFPLAVRYQMIFKLQ